MEIKQYVWDVVDANSWLVTENKHGLLIDAVDNPELYEALQPLESLTIILTHCHFDHICGLNRIREIRPDCIVISTKLCSEHIGNKYRNMSSCATAFMSFYRPNEIPVQIKPFECKPVEKQFEEHLVFEWQNNGINLYAVYGHTNDGLIAVINDKYLFSGDTLLHIPTATRFLTGSEEQFLMKDIPLLKQLWANVIFPGHGDKGMKNKMMTSI